MLPYDPQKNGQKVLKVLLKLRNQDPWLNVKIDIPPPPCVWFCLERQSSKYKFGRGHIDLWRGGVDGGALNGALIGILMVWICRWKKAYQLWQMQMCGERGSDGGEG